MICRSSPSLPTVISRSLSLKTADMQVQSDGIYLHGAPPQLWLYRCQVWLGGALLLCMLTLGIRSWQQGLLIFWLLGVLALAAAVAENAAARAAPARRRLAAGLVGAGAR